MRLLAIVVLMIVLLAGLPMVGWTNDGQPSSDEWIQAPFRIRDLTFPTVLVMGFLPRAAQSLPAGDWAVEFNYSVANNFQVSFEVEEYLEQRGGGRRRLGPGDVDNLLSQLEGDQFYVDSEYGLFDLGIHCGITDRLTASLRLSYLKYGGGYLDSTIFNFHDTFNLGQSGRDYVEENQFQLFFMNGDEPFVQLERPTSGGFTDPVLSLSSTFPGDWHGWRFGIEAGFKVPLADEDLLLSSGGFDFGMQLTAQKQWRRNALVLNLAYVVPGDFEPSDSFDPSDLPSFNLSYLHRMGRRTTGFVQLFFSENIFHDVTDSDLSELEFQLSVGVKTKVFGGIIGFGVTENLFNFDNTPDVALHLSYGVVLD
jgi:hypothetical protein